MTVEGFPHLGPGGRAAGLLAARPRWPVYAALLAGVALSWFILLALAVRAGPMTPGGNLLAWLDGLPLPALFDRLLELCLTPAPAGEAAPAFAAMTAMWFAMSVATMLPSAAPMIRTYCELADTAGAKGEDVVHPLVFVAGYLAVWFAASAAFATATLAVQSLANPTDYTASGLRAASASLAIAGLYQFSGLKQACLEKCRHPFALLFARWSTRRPAIFRLGAEQGLWCLGCCWALMLIMFAVGVMNVFWMALIGLFTIVEKQASGRLASRAAGAILLVWSAALLLLSVGQG